MVEFEMVIGMNGKIWIKSEKLELASYIGKIYTPKVNDVVIGLITLKTLEFYKLYINSNFEATLNTIDFEGATRKTRPKLNIGDIVFGRVINENKFYNTIISCRSIEDTKTWSTGESMFGQLIDGRLYDINREYIWSLYNNNKIIERLKDMVEFEMVIGMNGKIWIKSEKLEDNIKIYQCILESFKKNNNEMETYMNNLFNYNNNNNN
jgi:exosome complex component RRP40